MKEYYLIGSLRNKEATKIANALRDGGIKIFDSWYAASENADDCWRDYEKAKGLSFKEALSNYAAQHVFQFDKFHLDRCDGAILLCPAGKSGHLELGYVLGQGKPGYILLSPEIQQTQLPETWYWLAGIYEGEGSLTRNGSLKPTNHGMQLTVTMKDKDVITRLYQIAKVGTIEGPYKRSNPKWSDMYRWAVRKKQDIFYVLRGIFEYLSERRKLQVQTVIQAAGLDMNFLVDGHSPKQFRWDVMYNFATAVCSTYDELLTELKK